MDSDTDTLRLLVKLIEVSKHHIKEKNRRQIYEAVCSELFLDDLEVEWSEIFGIDSAFDETVVELYPDSFNMTRDDEEIDDDTNLSVVAALEEDESSDSDDEESLWDGDND